MTTNNTLSKRGIQQTAKLFGWHEKGNRWHYPVFDIQGNQIGTRSKATTGGGSKYLWEDFDGNGRRMPKNPYASWYILPDTIEHIKNADGVVYVANGEASCLAHITATVYNTIATTLSEVAIPDNILTVLQAIKVSRVVLLADNDDAGMKSAINYRDALSGSGIHFEAYGWGDGKKQGYDSNDAWIDCGFNVEAFKARLGSLQALVLPAPEPKVERRQFNVDDFENTPQGLIDALASALGVKAWRSNGWCKNVSSPFHEDKKPSFGIRQDTGVGKDFATDESYSPVQIAEQLGIDWKRFYPNGGTPYRNDTKPVIDIEKHLEIAERVEFKKLLQEKRQERQQSEITWREQVNKKREQQDAIKNCYIYDSEALPGGIDGASWIEQEYLPKTWVQALLGLAVANSAVVPVLLKLHYAFRIGMIDACEFTRKDVDKLIGSRRKSTESALETLCLWGFVSKVHIVFKRDSSNTNDTKPKTGGRPTQYQYRIATTDADLISATISDMMHHKIVEQLSKQSFAPRLAGLAYDIGLDRDEAKAWQKRTNTIKDDRIESLATYLSDQWREKLWDYAPLAISGFNNARDIRVFMLISMLKDNPAGIQLPNSVLAMELGCSESNLSGLYKVANVDSKRMRKWHTIDKLDGLNLDAEIKTAQRDNQGKALAIQIHYTDADHPGKKLRTSLIYGENAWYASMANHKNDMYKITVMIEQPSLIRLLHPLNGLCRLIWQAWLLDYLIVELPDAEAYEAEQADSTEDDGAEIPVEITDLPVATEKPKRSPSQSGKVERDWSKFSQKFIWNQLNLEAHVLTEDGVIPTNLTAKQAVGWIADRVGNKPVRTVASYFEKDDDESTLLDYARFLGGQKVTGLALAERQDSKPLPVPIELPDKADEYAKPEHVTPKAQYEVVVKGLNMGRNRKTKRKNRFSGIAS